ncbi:hypothetical protein EDB83DRAFT_2584039 [Lactarius deliciosus]|nr:hypothetical protein EDB83DRAFT_2584039 [Lactarius deliciosus]
MPGLAQRDWQLGVSSLAFAMLPPKLFACVRLLSVAFGSPLCVALWLLVFLYRCKYRETVLGVSLGFLFAISAGRILCYKKKLENEQIRVGTYDIHVEVVSFKPQTHDASPTRRDNKFDLMGNILHVSFSRLSCNDAVRNPSRLTHILARLPSLLRLAIASPDARLDDSEMDDDDAGSSGDQDDVEHRLESFLNDPELSMKIFFSSYFREKGLVW